MIDCPAPHPDQPTGPGARVTTALYLLSARSNQGQRHTIAGMLLVEQSSQRGIGGYRFTGETGDQVARHDAGFLGRRTAQHLGDPDAALALRFHPRLIEERVTDGEFRWVKVGYRLLLGGYDRRVSVLQAGMRTTLERIKAVAEGAGQ